MHSKVICGCWWIALLLSPTTDNSRVDIVCELQSNPYYSIIHDLYSNPFYRLYEPRDSSTRTKIGHSRNTKKAIKHRAQQPHNDGEQADYSRLHRAKFDRDSSIYKQNHRLIPIVNTQQSQQCRPSCTRLTMPSAREKESSVLRTRGTLRERRCR